ncbi:MAG: DnaJ domain-containing protein [Crocinitomicaceae bacterium]|nr:DnaJ domain-containing protein [Crocinitomicaceae bacterium]
MGSFLLNIYFPSQDPHGSGDGLDGPYFMFWFLLPFIWAFGYLIYKRYISKEVEVDGFDFNSEFCRDTLMEAYIYLAAEMIKSDTSQSAHKISYMNSYFAKHFGENNFEFKKILVNAYRNPAPVHKIAAWVQLHLDHSQRLQVMYFLAGLSMVDGSIQGLEMRILSKLSQVLELSPKEFQSIIGMYKKQEEKRKAKTTYIPIKSRLKTVCEILGVSEHAGMDEIKKAYRSMVKKHHPDRFYNESEEQQKIAEERFLRIQEAYETIEKLK